MVTVLCIVTWQDIALISLANVLHKTGRLNEAIIITNMALEISSKLVVTHFTMANLYAAKVRSSLMNIAVMRLKHFLAQFEVPCFYLLISNWLLQELFPYGVKI